MLDLNSLTNATVYDRDGEKIGTVGSVYAKDQTDKPSFMTVKTGLFGTKETFVPIEVVKQDADGAHVPYTKAFVKDAPNVDADGHIDPAEEDEIARYYSRWESKDSAHGLTGGVADSDRTGRAQLGREREDDGSMIRREEEVRVVKERVETGRVRLRKRIVTEKKTIQVPVQREEFEVINEDAPAAGARMSVAEGQDVARAEGTGNAAPATGQRDGLATADSADDGFMVRREEELHVSKERVETGQVRMRKRVVTETKEITVEVQREEFEVIEEPAGGKPGDKLGDDEQVLVLFEERPVVQKDVVDKERISLEKNVISEQQRISAEVSKEEVDVDRQDGTKRTR